jgi:hypothetical protein
MKNTINILILLIIAASCQSTGNKSTAIEEQALDAVKNI